ncbi:MAG: EAL domain-containing protein [Pelosinus sp.]|nr:EAL domain-containing protein [Pelosinus sp.]
MVNRGNKWVLTGFVWIIALFVLYYPFNKTAAAPLGRNILIINSYHYGNPFSDGETEGILKALHGSDANILINIEYMDWKNHPSSKRRQTFYEDIKLKYANQKIDLIVAEDDPALEFALAYRKELFADCPIVFCGVNEDSRQKIITNQKRVSGIIEDTDGKGTTEAALKINPHLKDIYIIHDNSKIGIAMGNLTAQQVYQISADIKVHFVNKMTTEQICNFASTLSNNSIVLITTFLRDNYGNSVVSTDFCRMVSQNSAVPVYHLYDYALGYGTIGGNLFSPVLHGEAAGQMAIQVLNGANIDDIPISYEKNTRLVFDYNSMKRFGIELPNLPEGSEVINKPFSFYENYKTMVNSVLAAFVLLLLFSGSLLFNIRKRKYAEHVLREKNEELNSLYEELASSEEELRINYTELSQKQVDLIKSEERHSLVLEGSNDVIWDYDVKTNHIYFSERILDMLGYEDECITSMEAFKAIVHPEDRPLLEPEKVIYDPCQNSHFYTEVRLKCRDGEYKWAFIRGKVLIDTEGVIVRIAGSMTDITAKKNNEQKMYYMAYYDMLTGVANRASLEKAFAELGAKRDAVIIFLDVDYFKHINDTMGHSFGDKVLINLAEILAAYANPHVLVTRLGGDEFTILYTDYQQQAEINNYAQSIMQALDTPLCIDDTLIKISISMGIACYPQDGQNFGEILKNADTALYYAKNGGRKRYVYFKQTMNDELAKRLKLETDLQEALLQHQFILHYQPQVDVYSGRICGFESLVRWIRPGVGLVFPGEFIGVTEETGLIIEMGKVIIGQACAFVARLKREIGTDLCVSVNVSAIQFEQDDFIEVVVAAITSAGINPASLGIEITETVCINNFADTAIKIDQLRNMGIEVLLDDFGTGYASLKYLRHLAITKLKMDKTFIDDAFLTTKPEENIIETIILLAHKLGMQVVAEGVEKREQLDLLAKYQCDIIQGYYFSKPLPEEEALNIVQKYNG